VSLWKRSRGKKGEENMKITDWEFKKKQNTVEVSADVDGFRLWYRMPSSYRASRAGDPFLAAALLPAMVRGEELDVDPRMPISPKLLQNLSLWQEIHHCWNPVLKIIPIKATTRDAESLNDGAMSFYSGGVDSTYTFLKRMKDISHIVFIQGFDFYVNNGEASTFSAGDLGDLSQFAFKLMLAGDPVSAFLKARLSKNTLHGLFNCQSSGSDLATLEAALTLDLNKIIAGQSIYEARRFAGVRLRPETRELLVQVPDRKNLSTLNRLLLEDAYPLEIAKKTSLTYQTAIERNTSFAQSFGKTLIPVATNHFPFGYRYNLSRVLTFGSALASVALMLGFPIVYVPSSYAYSQLFPQGSHPLTDPLWSTEGVTIIHDGAEVLRVDKVKKITKCQSALANLRVCFDDMNFNCGKCPKCLRTMISLKLLHESRGPFPPFPSFKVIRKLRISGEVEMAYFKENVQLTLKADDLELREALCACLKKYEWRQLLGQLDKLLFGGHINRVRRRFEKTLPGIRRIDTTP
jgi:hypothetical protein